MQDETVASYVEVPDKSDISVKRHNEVRAVPSGPALTYFNGVEYRFLAAVQVLSRPYTLCSIPPLALV